MVIAKDLGKVLCESNKSDSFSGSKVASDFKKAFNNQTAEYKIGKEWGNGFIDRYIDVKHSTISGDEDSTISADDIWGTSDENNDSVPEKEDNKIEEFDPYEQRRLETLSEIDDAKPYFKKLKKIASETKTKRFDFYGSWMKKQKLMEDQQKNHLKNFVPLTILETKDTSYLLQEIGDQKRNLIR